MFRSVNIEIYNDTKPAVLIKGEGKVTIQLESTNTVSSPSLCAGIQKSDKVALTITSSKNGELTATGGDFGAGIGGGNAEEGSNITITGNAQVTATGGKGGAGIGGGTFRDGSNITIRGSAKVVAIGGNGGAGIGGGKEGAGSGIFISGDAQVEATGGNGGAGIGGGKAGNNGEGGAGSNIIISESAKVKATGGKDGAGIGGGRLFAGSGIIISGDAQVEATGGDYGAGIGGGYGEAGSKITISGNAQVTATGVDYGAGIGGGESGAGSDITISGDAQVTATGGRFGAGIGGGESDEGTNITISGDAQVMATGGSLGAGIGGGMSSAGSDITISGDAQVTATGGECGAGIGGGGLGGKGSSIKVYDRAIVSVSGGENNKAYGAGAGVGDGGKFDSNGNPPEGIETVITFTDDDHKTFNGNVLYYEKGSSAESIEIGEATRINFVTITLKANDGTDTIIEQKESVGVPRNLQVNPFTRKGHSFTGWKNGNGTTYVDQFQQKWETDTILYAQWTEHVYDQTVADETKYRKAAATCTSAAVYYKSCACGAFDPDESGTFESGNPLGHDYKAIAGTAKGPTCTAAGKEADQECSRCHDVINGTEIARLAHTFDQEVATDKYLKTPADCTHKAVYFKSCVCGETGTETFEYGEMLGHSWKAATGYAPKTCEVCGATEGDVINYSSEGENIIEFTQGDTKDVVKIFHRSEDDKNAINHYKGVQIDGKDVPVDAKSGSVIITFDAATLNKLSVGDHIITVIFDDWVEELKLIIKAPVAAAVDATPVTGDSANPFLWTAMILLSMAFAAGIVMRRRKQA